MGRSRRHADEGEEVDDEAEELGGSSAARRSKASQRMRKQMEARENEEDEDADDDSGGRPIGRSKKRQPRAVPEHDDEEEEEAAKTKKGRKRKGSRKAGDDDDEEDGGGAGAGGRRRASTLGADELERKADELVRYLLSASRGNVPVTKTAINAAVMDGTSANTRAALELAETKLRDMFGLELTPIYNKDVITSALDASNAARNKTTAGAAAASARNKSQGAGSEDASAAVRASKGTPTGYVLLNALETDVAFGKGLVSLGSEETAKVGLLMVTLTIIYMRDGVVSEDELWKTLSMMGLTERLTSLSRDRRSGAAHFGEAAGALLHSGGEFVKQGYLRFNSTETGGRVRGTVTSSNADKRRASEKVEVRWGPRAHAEVPPQNCLHFVAELYGENAPAGLQERIRTVTRKYRVEQGLAGADAGAEDEA